MQHTRSQPAQSALPDLLLDILPDVRNALPQDKEQANKGGGSSSAMDDFVSDTDSDYTSYWRDWVSYSTFWVFRVFSLFSVHILTYLDYNTRERGR